MNNEFMAAAALILRAFFIRPLHSGGSHNIRRQRRFLAFGSGPRMIEF